jgi:DNA-binding transcriptional regulator YbjK
LKEGNFLVLLQEIQTRTEQQKQLDEVQKRHDDDVRALQLLEADIQQEHETFENKLEVKTKAIGVLTAELKKLKQVTELSLQYEESTMKAKLDTLKRTRDHRIFELRKQVEGLQAELSKNAFANDKNTEFLTKQKSLLDTIDLQWEQKHQGDLAKKNKNLQELHDLRETEKQKLNALQFRWKRDMEEKVQTMQELKKREIEKKAREYVQDLMEHAARKLQFYWRLRKRRMKGAKKGKDKKGKKGKKSKKGGDDDGGGGSGGGEAAGDAAGEGAGGETAPAEAPAA